MITPIPDLYAYHKDFDDNETSYETTAIIHFCRLFNQYPSVYKIGFRRNLDNFIKNVINEEIIKENFSVITKNEDNQKGSNRPWDIDDDEILPAFKLSSAMFGDTTHRAVLYISERTVYIIYHHVNSDTVFIDKLASHLQNKYGGPAEETSINIITAGVGGGLNNTSVSLHRTQEVDIGLNYGEDFVEKDKVIREFIADKDQSGLILLFGDPGTGKTSYIRMLLEELKDTEFTYLPPHMAPSISTPEFLPFLLDNPKSVFVIEDAEEVVRSRETGETSSVGVSNILNATDGIMGDCFKIKIICTFNTRLENIDPALRREGRLKLEHYFGRLSVRDCNKFLRAHGLDKEVDEPKTLGELYHLNKKHYTDKEEKPKMGF